MAVGAKKSHEFYRVGGLNANGTPAAERVQKFRSPFHHITFCWFYCFCAVNSPFESEGSTAIEPFMEVAESRVPV
jgi:hypothetical protein